jgi:hypothetical protein
MAIPFQRSYTLSATVVQLFTDNPNRVSYVVQNTGASNPMTVSFDGVTSSLILSAGSSVNASTLPTGKADYTGTIYAWSAAGTTCLAVELS